MSKIIGPGITWDEEYKLLHEGMHAFGGSECQAHWTKDPVTYHRCHLEEIVGNHLWYEPAGFEGNGDINGWQQKGGAAMDVDHLARLLTHMKWDMGNSIDDIKLDMNIYDDEGNPQLQFFEIKDVGYSCLGGSLFVTIRPEIRTCGICTNTCTNKAITECFCDRLNEWAIPFGYKKKNNEVSS